MRSSGMGWGTTCTLDSSTPDFTRAFLLASQGTQTCPKRRTSMASTSARRSASSAVNRILYRWSAAISARGTNLAEWG